jgi:hypothetical protein
MSKSNPSKSWPPKDQGGSRKEPPGGGERPDAPVGKCPTCGITLYRVMGYCCGRDACPVFGRSGTLKPFMCGGT